MTAMHNAAEENAEESDDRGCISLAKTLNQHFYKLLSIHRLAGGTAYKTKTRGFDLRADEVKWQPLHRIPRVDGGGGGGHNFTAMTLSPRARRVRRERIAYIK